MEEIGLRAKTTEMLKSSEAKPSRAHPLKQLDSFTLVAGL